MSALSIQPTFPIFTDLAGEPLEDGFVWIGTANLDPQTNPIAVYWDAALTIPAPQPIRTLAGYPARSGSPARLYVNSDYSIRVMNRNGSTVYSAPAATERYNDVVVDISATSVSFQQQGSSLVRTIADKGYESVTISDFPGADPTGATSSSAAIAAAMAAADTVIFEGGTYLIDQDLVLASNKRLIGKSGATIYRNSAVRVISQVTSDVPSLTALIAAADFLYGSTLVTLDASSYAAVGVGEYLYLENKPRINQDYIADFVALRNSNVTQLTSADEWVYQVQVFKIVEKLSGNAVRVNAGAHVDFALTTTSNIFKINSTVIENVNIEGLTFKNGPALSGTSPENSFINLRCAYNVNIKNNIFNLEGHTGGCYFTIGQVDVSGNEFNSPRQLGVFLRQAITDSTVTSNTFRNQTTGDASIFVEAHCYNVAIANNTFDGARLYELTGSAQLISCIEIDAKANNITITGNSGNGYGVGVRFELGAMFNTVSGNSFTNMGICGIRAEGCSYLTITGNTFYNCGITTTPGILDGAVGTLVFSSSSYCTVQGNVIGADSDYKSVWLVLSGQFNVIGNNILSNVNAFEVTNWNNRIYANDGDPFFRANDSIGPNTVLSFRDVNITSGVATTIATITTPDPAGSFDGGAFTCNINLMALSRGAGAPPAAPSIASKSQIVTFAAATNADGTSDQSAVSTIVTSGIADPGGFADLTDPVVSINKVNNYTYEVQVLSTISGTATSAKVAAAIQILWDGYVRPPFII
jgi:parallel beta-helix repeat protein